MEDAIRKKGMLYHYQQRFGKRWKKMWAVVLADSMYSVARLELFEYRQASLKESHVGKRADSKKVIPLRDCIQIVERDRGDSPKDCCAFLLETTDRMFTFAVQRAELQAWMQELCRLAFPMNQTESRVDGAPPSLLRDHVPEGMKENSLYETAACTQDFQVTAVGTEAALRCKLHGEYILSPQIKCLVLKDRKTKKVILSWPYCFVRKFGQDMLSFSFEAGRSCESGEGYFEFATSNSDRLFNIINNAIKNLPLTDQNVTKRKSSRKDKDQHITQNSQVTGDSCEYSTVSHTPLPAGGSAAQMQLGSMFRRLSLTSFDTAPTSQAKCSRAELNQQEPLYAMVSKPHLPPAEHTSSSLWTDPLGPPDKPLPKEPCRGAEPGELNGAEAIYAEPEDYDARVAWQYMDDYPASEEFWPSDEEVSDELFVPHVSAVPSTNTTLDCAAESFSIYDNLSIRRKL